MLNQSINQPPDDIYIALIELRFVNIDKKKALTTTTIN